MIDFQIIKKSNKSRARLGILKTPHGEVETPTLVGVATQATVKALFLEDVKETKTQLLICNTYHLHLRPGEKIVKAGGGLHKYMQWDWPLMTDSGGFQVFSLGFGKELGMSKILKQKSDQEISSDSKPKFLKITEDGVLFRSYIDGAEIFLGPKESIRIQEALGADIMFAFDECPPPIADEHYMRKSLEKTHRWAKICLSSKKTGQALYGIVQGGKHKQLRKESAEIIGSMPFDGFGIGGEFGIGKGERSRMLSLVTDILPFGKPRHLLGTGYIEDIPLLIKEGIDTFDTIVPTHYARRGIVFTSEGRLDLSKTVFLKDKKPIDRKCSCKVCTTYTRSYLTHLLRAHEITPLSLLSYHNLYFFNAYVAKLREDIKKGKL